MLAQLALGVDIGGTRYEVGDEPLVAGTVLHGDDDGALDCGKSGEDGLDLAELDAETAELDLLVGAAEEFDGTVGAPSCEVARAIEAAAGRPGGGGDEPFGREGRPVQINPPQ